MKEYVVGIYKNCTVMTRASILAKDLQLAGVEGQTDGKLCSSGEVGTDGKNLPLSADCNCYSLLAIATLCCIIIGGGTTGAQGARAILKLLASRASTTSGVNFLSHVMPMRMRRYYVLRKTLIRIHDDHDV